MSLQTGLDRLLAEPRALAGRHYGLLAHAASLSRELVPAHLALSALPDPPSVLFGPEHGYYGVEQDMVAAEGGTDPWTGLPVVSLYGDSTGSLVPRPEAFDGLDLLLIDLQDVGSRYYTYAATAVWSAQVALDRGCEVWVLDRPNPLGGERVEGNLPEPGLESFVSAFELPVRHGLTLGELLRLEMKRRGRQDGFRVWELEGWRRSQLWHELGRPWVAPSPNMPSLATALLYPGGCLVEATEVSEGRGTTRPFHLVGAPWIDPPRLAAAFNAEELPGLVAIPTYFRPQFQKHRGAVCGGVELVVTDPLALRPYWSGLKLLDVLARLGGEAFTWRSEPYEFVIDRPAIDLLTGSPRYRQAIESGVGLADLAATWTVDESRFLEERRDVLLYPEER